MTMQSPFSTLSNTALSDLYVQIWFRVDNANVLSTQGGLLFRCGGVAPVLDISLMRTVTSSIAIQVTVMNF